MWKKIIKLLDVCDIWVHTKYNKINAAANTMSQNDETKWFCYEYFKEGFPFSSLNKFKFFSLQLKKKNQNFWQKLKNDLLVKKTNKTT